jgi:hypothetical protein
MARDLAWYGEQEGRLGIPACDLCAEALLEPGLVESCASVGIEHGKSAGLMLREYINQFHAGGHHRG